MDNVERLFRHLVDVLSAAGHERIETPFQVSALYQSILPYRTHKKQLGFDTNQDYEMAILRLLAGEGGYASVEPGEVQEQLLKEVQSVNPNPGAFREFAAARVQLSKAAVRSVKSASQAYAPPEPAPEPEQPLRQWAQYAPPSGEPQPPDHKPPVFEAVELAHTAGDVHAPGPDKSDTSSNAPAAAAPDLDVCPHCAEMLPAGRKIVFCPYCGERVGSTTCTECGDEIEAGWRFCVTCGRRATEG